MSEDNTTLEVDLADPETIKSLPASARIFLVKYCELLGRDLGVTSETVGPMSQSFSSDSVSKQTADTRKADFKTMVETRGDFYSMSEAMAVKVKWKTKNNLLPTMEAAVPAVERKKSHSRCIWSG